MRECRRSARRIAAAAVLVVTGALGVSLDAAGQEAASQDDPIVIGQREETPKFYLEDPKYDLTLIGQYASDEQTDPQGSSELKELRFDEILGLKTRGHVIHPNLLDFKFDGAFGLSQSQFEFDGEKTRQDGTLYEFDFLAEFLKRETTHYSVYARRNRDLVNLQFAPSLENTTTTYGATVETTVKRVMMRLDAFRNESVQTSIDETEFVFNQNVVQWTAHLTPTENQRMRLEYLYTGTDQSAERFDEETAYDTHEFDAEHFWRFGERSRNELRSQFRYFNQTGDFALERISLTEQLRIWHTDTLRTDYLYRYTNHARDDFDQDQHQAEARFHHRLYRSLVTDGRIGAIQFSSSEGGDSTELYADLETQYEKIVPLGLLTLDFGLNFGQTSSDASSGGIQIIDASTSFTDPAPIILYGRNIDPRSIVVTSPAGLRYIEGQDYLIQSAFADRVELARIPTGRIANGQTILIDYALGPTEESESTTAGFNAGARYVFEQGPLKGLQFFINYALQEQRIEPEDSAIPLSDFTDTLYGTEYRRGPLTLRAEQQIHDAEIVPFEATRFLARLNHRSGDTTVTGDLGYAIIDYEDPSNHVELWSASASVAHRFSRELNGTATVIWRDQTDDLAGHTQGFEQQMELNWKHRQTEIFMLLRNASFDSEDLDTEYQLLQIGIRREF